MPTFYSPEGNPEVWEEKPEGYLTEDEWFHAHPEEERPRDFDPEEWRSLRFSEIDLASIRPLRAIIAGVGTAADARRLQELEGEARALRAEAAAAAGEGGA